MPKAITRIPIAANQKKGSPLEAASLKLIGATEKYELCKLNKQNNNFSFSYCGDLWNFVGREYDFDKEGDFNGSVVLFGDIDNKRYDYIFSKEISESGLGPKIWEIVKIFEEEFFKEKYILHVR